MPRVNYTPKAVHSQRAEWAWQKVFEIHELDGSPSKKYATEVRKLPARIQVNGLGHAFAFLFSRSKKCDGARRLLLQLGERIAVNVMHRERAPTKPEALMNMLVTMSPDAYRRATHELMTTAGWMKRFVDGLFDKEED
jgi:CRISPR type III-B/RAMP module-associated protein Cmr5